MKFNDGVEFKTNCSLRIIEKFDGFYVVGDGQVIPVNSIEEGCKIINEIKASKKH